MKKTFTISILFIIVMPFFAFAPYTLLFLALTDAMFDFRRLGIDNG